MAEVLAGNLAAALKLSSTIDRKMFVGAGFYEALLAMVDALVQDIPDALFPKASVLRSARVRLHESARRHPEITGNQLLRRQYFRALRFLAQQANQPLRAMWYSFRLNFI
jgi:hypothetical protein